MRGAVKRWGNSAAVRIPAAVLEASQVQVDEEVDIREESGRIVIEQVREKKYKLDDLLKKITTDNIHEEVDLGKPEGKEVW
jgi:antitoxin MazE